MKGIADFEAAVAAANLPGVVALVTDSKATRYHRAFGMADAVGGVPMREDAAVPDRLDDQGAYQRGRAASLVERGKLDLDAPVGSDPARTGGTERARRL